MKPNIENFKFFSIDINDGKKKSINELREIFVKPDMELGHKFESALIDYRQSFEYCLYNSLMILWDKLREEKTIDVKIKSEFFQTVYSLSRLYIKFQIRSLLNEYDKAVQTLDKPKQKMKAEEIKNLAKQLFLIQWQTAVIISPQVSFLKNKKEFYKALNNSKTVTYSKPQTEPYKKLFVRLLRIRDDKNINATNAHLFRLLDKIIKIDKIPISYSGLDKYIKDSEKKDEIKKYKKMEPEEESKLYRIIVKSLNK